MRTNRLAAAAALGALVVAAAASAEDKAFDLEPGTHVLAPLRYKQLTLFPVARDVQARPAAYATLEGGLKAKVVKVRELGEVNRVEIANDGDKPLLVLGGEVLLGGQQDRVIGQDTIVQAHQKLRLEVFCVEHGRWSGGGQFERVGAFAEAGVKARAKYHEDQGAVWAQVAHKNAALGAAAGNDTGTYRRLADGPEGRRAAKPYREHLAEALNALPDAKKLVGVIAAVNGRVTSVDVFESPDLFASYKDRLLDALFVSVADVAETPAAAQAPTSDAVKGFVEKARASKPAKVLEHPGSYAETKSSAGVVGSTLAPAAPKSSAAGPAAAPVYESYQVDQ